jgi:putative transposase
MIEPANPTISIRRQCELIGLNRASLYYQPASETEFNLKLMRLIDRQYLKTPYYGYPKMTAHLRREGYTVNPKRIRRLMRKMGLMAIYPKPRTTISAPENKVYPYLLRGLAITRPNQVWSTDITYIPMQKGFMYLVAVMDWWSRYVLGWRLSNTLEAAFCVDAWEAALRAGRQAPLVSNTDQGSQFTSPMFIDAVESAGVEVSMDGRGRWIDNRFIERLWRSAKYEDIYLQDYGDGLAAGRGLGRWFDGYNQERPHQALGYATPAEVYHDPGAHGAQPASWQAMQPQKARSGRKT